MNQKNSNSVPNPESQLESTIMTIVDQPLDQAAIERVKASAKSLASKPELAQSDLESDQVQSISVNNPRTVSPKSSRLSRLAWVCSIAASIALVVGLMFFPSSNSAFAAALEKLRLVESLSFEMTSITTIKDSDLEVPTVKSKFYVAADGRVRVEMDGMEIVSAFNDKPGMLVDHDQKQASIIGTDEQQEFSHLQWFEALKSYRSEPVKELGKKAMFDTEVEGFVVKDADGEYTIWVDPKTEQLVQVELEESVGNSRVKLVINQIQYDVELDDSIFQLELPEGYEIVEPEGPLSAELIEENFIEGLKYLVEKADGVFPKSLDSSSQYGIRAQQLLDDVEEFSINATAIETLVMLYPEHEYLGPNKKFGHKKEMVFWYRDFETKKLRAIYSDFTAAEIEESQIPKKDPMP